jgi:hypothetical protein
MKAIISINKDRDEKGIIVRVFVKKVESGSELETILKGLGYINLGWGSFRADVRSAEELDRVRKPILDFVTA